VNANKGAGGIDGESIETAALRRRKRFFAGTLAGIELAHRIRKRQFSFGAGRPRRVRSLKTLWDRALA
jgi:hypothetical protein